MQQGQDSEGQGSHRRAGRAVYEGPERAGWLKQGGPESGSRPASLPLSPQAVPVHPSRRERALVGGGAPRGLGPARQHLAQGLSSGGATSRR